MSTPPRDSRAAAKRRAESRRRRRELGKQVFAYAIVGLLLLGTVSSVFIFQSPVIAPVPTPVGAVFTPTISQEAVALNVLLTQGDQAVASENYTDAIGYYNAYIAAAPGNGEVNLKLAKAHINKQPPDYAAAVQQLNTALQTNPTAPWAPEAQELLKLYQPRVTPGTAITGTVTLTGTQPISPTGSPVP